jgi:hypothetical protein
VVFTGWLLRHEIRVRREEKTDSDAAQARLIIGVVVDTEASGTDPETGESVASCTRSVVRRVARSRSTPPDRPKRIQLKV